MFGKKQKVPNKRLLTASEREFILERLENRNIGALIVIAAVLVALFVVFAILIVPMGMEFTMKILSPIFLLVIFGVVVVTYYVLSMKTVLRKIRANELYVAEAIYEGSSGKPYRVYLSGYKKAYGGYGLQMAEKFKPGDKVIVIEKPGVVYKARG